MNDLDKRVAKAIINAQLCSDAGKGIYEIENTSMQYKMCKKGYKGKDTQIFKAIDIINRKKDTGFYYSVKEDTQGKSKYIVYFNFKINGKRKQISFHSFDNRLSKFISSKCQTRWDKNNSRQAAIELQSLLFG